MTCKDCIHCEACERMISDTSKMFKVLLSEILKMNCDIKYDSTNILSGAEICQCFQDRSRFVELPCKLGDSVYILGEKIIEDEIFDFEFERHWEGKISKTACCKNSLIDIPFTDFGRLAFLTKEEAEQALKEREENG